MSAVGTLQTSMPTLSMSAAGQSDKVIVNGTVNLTGATLRVLATARVFALTPAARGEPGYWQHLDRDKDGIACEPWPRRGLPRSIHHPRFVR